MNRTNKLKQHKTSKGRILCGIFLLICSFSLLCYNLWESEQAAKTSEQILKELTGETVEGNMEMNIQNTEDIAENKTANGQDYIGILEIPKLNLTLPIIKEWDDGRLKIAPCRYYGTIEENNLIIAGHNYRSHFSRIKKLEEGDEIIFTDLNNQTCHYSVSNREVIKGNDTEKMMGGKWDLTLFTCTYGGGERFVLRCRIDKFKKQTIMKFD